MLKGSREAPLTMDDFAGEPYFGMPCSEAIFVFALNHPKAREVWLDAWAFHHLCASLGRLLGTVYPASKFSVEVMTGSGVLTVRTG